MQVFKFERKIKMAIEEILKDFKEDKINKEEAAAAWINTLVFSLVS